MNFLMFGWIDWFTCDVKNPILLLSFYVIFLSFVTEDTSMYFDQKITHITDYQ